VTEGAREDGGFGVDDRAARGSTQANGATRGLGPACRHRGHAKLIPSRRGPEPIGKARV